MCGDKMPNAHTTHAHMCTNMSRVSTTSVRSYVTILLAALCLLTACATSTLPECPEPQCLSEAELLVLGAVAQYVRPPLTNGVFVSRTLQTRVATARDIAALASSPCKGPVALEQMRAIDNEVVRQEWQEAYRKEWEGMVADLVKKDSPPAMLPDSFGKQIGVRVLDAKEELWYFSSHHKKKLYAKYPEYVGLVRLSRVGFNKRQDRAIVYAECYVGKMAAQGSFYFLEWDGTQWCVARKCGLDWIS